MSSPRDNWERLVTAAVKRQQIWELCHQQSRSPSISTLTSDDSSQQILSFQRSNLDPFSVPTSPLFPPKIPSISQVRNKATSGHIIRMLFFPWYRKRKLKEHEFIKTFVDATIPLSLLQRFSVDELRVATRDFSDIIERDVFRGWLADGSQVAVKKYPNIYEDIHEQFRRAVEINSMVSHPNVIHILGFCIVPNESLIVYPLMVNGSVASSLRDSAFVINQLSPERCKSQPLLNWETRVSIALGTARGVVHLHQEICDKKIIHRDIKADNILLDEDFNAVLSDMGLSIIGEHETPYVEDAVRGTIGHIDPEYFSTGRCSEKSDVFSYGVFLLQLITGHNVFGLARLANGEDMPLLKWIERLWMENKLELIVDANCGSDNMEVLVEPLVQISLLCTRYNSEKRPKMSEVVRMLDCEDGLSERWEEFLKNKGEKEKEKDPWIIDDDTFDTEAEQLSGPR